MIKDKIVFLAMPYQAKATGGIHVQWHTAENKEIAEASRKQICSTGLTSQQVAALEERFGKNELAAKKKKTLIQRFLAQLQDFMVLFCSLRH